MNKRGEKLFFFTKIQSFQRKFFVAKLKCNTLLNAHCRVVLSVWSVSDVVMVVERVGLKVM